MLRYWFTCCKVYDLSIDYVFLAIDWYLLRATHHTLLPMHEYVHLKKADFLRQSLGNICIVLSDDQNVAGMVFSEKSYFNLSRISWLFDALASRFSIWRIKFGIWTKGTICRSVDCFKYCNVAFVHLYKNGYLFYPLNTRKLLGRA